MADRQQVTEYKPTQKEKALLEALLDPNNKGATITSICQQADCSRQLYYQTFAKPDFVEHYKQLSMQMVKQHIGPLINAFVEQAANGSFPHGKVLLEMAGLYNNQLNLNIGQVHFSGDDALED